MVHPEYVVADKGKKKVILSESEFDQLMDIVDELYAIKVFDTAIARNEETIPFNQATSEIEKNR